MTQLGLGHLIGWLKDTSHQHCKKLPEVPNPWAWSSSASYEILRWLCHEEVSASKDIFKNQMHLDKIYICPLQALQAQASFRGLLDLDRWPMLKLQKSVSKSSYTYRLLLTLISCFVKLSHQWRGLCYPLWLPSTHIFLKEVHHSSSSNHEKLVKCKNE